MNYSSQWIKHRVDVHGEKSGGAEIRDTVLHEIAHALVGPEARHGPEWKAIAKRLGATPRANVYEKRGR